MTTPPARDRGRAKADILQQLELSATSTPDCPPPDLGAMDGSPWGPDGLKVLDAARQLCGVRVVSLEANPLDDVSWRSIAQAMAAAMRDYIDWRDRGLAR